MAITAAATAAAATAAAAAAGTAAAGIEHDIKVWGPSAPGPQPPPAAALRRAMTANQRERQSAREAYSEPEQWLMQLLTAQRRRCVRGESEQESAVTAPLRTLSAHLAAPVAL